MERKKEIHPKRRLKAKNASEIYPDGSYIKYKIKFSDKELIVFIIQTDYKHPL